MLKGGDSLDTAQRPTRQRHGQPAEPATTPSSRTTARPATPLVGGAGRRQADLCHPDRPGDRQPRLAASHRGTDAASHFETVTGTAQGDTLTGARRRRTRSTAASGGDIARAAPAATTCSYGGTATTGFSGRAGDDTLNGEAGRQRRRSSGGRRPGDIIARRRADTDSLTGAYRPRGVLGDSVLRLALRRPAPDFSGTDSAICLASIGLHRRRCTRRAGRGALIRDGERQHDQRRRRRPTRCTAAPATTSLPAVPATTR